MKPLMLVLIAALVALLIASVARAQTACPLRVEMETDLRDTHGMTEVAAGFVASRQVVQMWCNAETGAWAITVTDGMTSCLIGGGRAGCYGLRPRPNL